MIKSYSPYVYLGINRVTNKFYIGARYSHCKHKRNSVDDLGIVYYTSSKVVKPMFAQFDWTILAHFATKEDALDYETQLISEHWNNPLLLNRNIGGKKFHRPDNYIKRPYCKKDRSATMMQLERWQLRRKIGEIHPRFNTCVLLHRVQSANSIARWQLLRNK